MPPIGSYARVYSGAIVRVARNISAGRPAIATRAVFFVVSFVPIEKPEITRVFFSHGLHGISKFQRHVRREQGRHYFLFFIITLEAFLSKR